MLHLPHLSPTDSNHLVVEGCKEQHRRLRTALDVRTENGGAGRRAEHHQGRKAMDVHLYDRTPVGGLDVCNEVERDAQGVERGLCPGGASWAAVALRGGALHCGGACGAAQLCAAVGLQEVRQGVGEV